MNYLPVTQNELYVLLDNIYVAFTESGASYDTDLEVFNENAIARLEQEHQFTHMEF